MKAILNVCRKVKDISDEDFDAALEMAEQQLNYISPLRPMTQGKANALGQHNRAVVTKLRELRDVIRAGAEVAEQRR